MQVPYSDSFGFERDAPADVRRTGGGAACKNETKRADRTTRPENFMATMTERKKIYQSPLVSLFKINACYLRPVAYNKAFFWVAKRV